MTGKFNFYSGPDDCQWLRGTALRGYHVPPFQSFALQGHEDCPLALELYAVEMPHYLDIPVLSCELVTGRDNLGVYVVR